MVDNDDKPFPCSSPGCSMKFANEDHLSIHKKRHNMALTIESENGAKTPTFIADETPTPTRFIRNCEEVGLFQDLQNVNPFDEQFRRAAEAATSTPSPATHRYTDDVLHTPSVFPLTTDTELNSLPQFHPPKTANVRRSYSNLMPTLSTSDCLLPTSPLPTPTPSIVIFPPTSSTQQIAAVDLESAPKICSNHQRNQVPVDQNMPNSQKKKPGRKPVIKSNSKGVTNSSVNIMPRPTTSSVSPPVNDPLQLLLRLPDGRLVQIPAIPVGSTEAEPPQYQPVAPTVNQSNVEPPKTALSEAKLKLKQVLTKAKSAGLAKTSPQVPSDNSGTDTDQGIITQPSFDSNKCESPSADRRRSYQSASDPDDDEGEKRRKFLERNRAAAYRSRQKRKRWVSNLEAKNASLNNANKMLQNEVIALRGEVAQLKLQLLAHKDCPVTLAVCNQTSADINRDGVYISNPASPGRNLLALAPPVASIPQNQPRQIIILNTGSAMPLINKPISPSVVINQPPLVVLPSAISDHLHKEPSSNLALVGTNPPPRLEVPQGQETSVIISLKTHEK